MGEGSYTGNYGLNCGRGLVALRPMQSMDQMDGDLPLHGRCMFLIILTSFPAIYSTYSIPERKVLKHFSPRTI